MDFHDNHFLQNQKKNQQKKNTTTFDHKHNYIILIGKWGKICKITPQNGKGCKINP